MSIHVHVRTFSYFGKAILEVSKEEEEERLKIDGDGQRKLLFGGGFCCC